MEKKIDGRIIAQKKEINILRALHRFGWLRTKDIAQLCWTRWADKPRAEFNFSKISPSESSLRMSQRTMKRLLEKRQVIVSKAPNGSVIYSLSESGARRLSEIGLKSKSGKDLIRGFSDAFFQHRCIANEIAIAAIVQGFGVSTEREIAQGNWFGGVHGIDGKRPDVVIRQVDRVIFVEVENSRKNKTDYTALLSWLRKQISSPNVALYQSGDRKMKLSQAIFVCTLIFQKKLQRDLRSLGVNDETQNSFIRYSTDLYSVGNTIAF